MQFIEKKSVLGAETKAGTQKYSGLQAFERFFLLIKYIRSLFSILLIALKFRSIELFDGLHDLLLIFADLFKKRFVRQRNGAAHGLC